MIGFYTTFTFIAQLVSYLQKTGYDPFHSIYILILPSPSLNVCGWTFTWASCALWLILFLIDYKLSNAPHRFAKYSYISVQEHVSQVPYVQIVKIKAELTHNTNMSPHHKPQEFFFPHGLNFNNNNRNKPQYKKNSATLLNLHQLSSHSQQVDLRQFAKYTIYVNL